MTATQLLNNIIIVEPAMNKLQMETNVLYELYEMKKFKEVPFLVIRRAIKLQKKLINKLNK